MVAAAVSLRADVNTPAEFKVTDTVVRAAGDFSPLGVDGYGERGTDYAGNNFFRNSGNEPIHWGELYRATNIEGKSFELANESTSFYDLYNDGFLSGAEVRVYRIVDAGGKPLPVAENAKQPALSNFASLPPGARVVLVGKTHVLAPGEDGFPSGGWVVANPPAGRKPNRVYLASDAPELQRLDYIALTKEFGSFDMGMVHPRVSSGKGEQPNWYWTTAPDKAVKYAIVPHPGKVPADMPDPGKACMQVEASAGEVTIWQIDFIGPEIPNESLYYGQLEPGKTYRMEAWMCQQGLDGGGEVKFSLTPTRAGLEGLGGAFKVDGQWKKYTCDFTAPPRPKGLHYGPGFTFKGPGKLWIDNARLFRYDKPDDLTARFVPNRTILDALAASQPATGRKGTHRSWMLSRDLTMDAVLSFYPNSHARVSGKGNTSVSGIDGRTLPVALGYDYLTGDSPETRMVPHIVIQHITHSEGDWQHFVEYLAAPYDPATDTPGTKPYAYRRYVQRGNNGRPWTDEFREIIVELGNETWHNRANDNWIGFSLYKAVNQGGAEYGLFSEYLIEGMKKSPWWAKGKLDDRLHFALGANYGSVRDGAIKGYGELAMQRCPAATYLAHANYVGPKWETGETALSELNDDGIMATLMAYQQANRASQDKMAEARKMLEAQGVHYKLLAYEGGPSGYVIGEKDPKKIDATEHYGKSLAMAVAATDSWLGSTLQGWSLQNYFQFGQGQKWTSHTMMSDGFRPQAGWLALGMRNHFAQGSLMKVDEVQMPTCNFGAPKPVPLPLVGVYAMKDGNRWSVFVLSRKLNGTAAGQNMGDGFSKVSIHLPFATAGSVTLHRLTGDPRATNIESDKVKVESLPLKPVAVTAGTLNVDAATGGGENGMPPGSIFLYVIEGAK